jgi:hypothetical protein
MPSTRFLILRSATASADARLEGRAMLMQDRFFGEIGAQKPRAGQASRL